MNINFNHNIGFYGINPPKSVTKKVITESAAHILPDRKPAITSQMVSPAKEKGALDAYNIGIINEIRELFELAHSSIKAVAKSCSTRSAIKNGYPKLKKGVAGSRILEFEGIGRNGEDISINLRIDHKKTPKTVVIIGDKQLVINPKGQIEKNPSMRFVRDANTRAKGDTVQYYTQNEINKLDTEGQFLALKSELKKYIDYINSRHKQINSIREKKANNTPGTISDYKSTINSITKKFTFFKKNLNKLSYNALDKDIFRIENRIKTFHAQNSIMFKKATPDERSLYLIYSKINQKPAMKLFVMDYNNKTVDKSFVIYDNKLAKFLPKKANTKPSHLEYDFHYYTQEEIDNSELGYYLDMVDEKLDELNTNLKDGIKERLSKK